MGRILVNDVIIIDVSKVFLDFNPRIILAPLMRYRVLTLILITTVQVFFSIVVIYLSLVIFGFLKTDRIVRAVTTKITLLTTGCRLYKLVNRIYGLVFIPVIDKSGRHVDLSECFLPLLLVPMVMVLE